MNNQNPGDADISGVGETQTPDGAATNAEAEVMRDDQAVMPASPALSENRLADALVEERIQEMSRRSFLWGAVAIGATVGGVRWIGSRRAEEGIAWPLRRGLQVNECLSRDFFSEMKLAPEFPRARARAIRVNGDIGMDEDFDPGSWKLMVEGLADENEPMREFSLAQIKALPRVTMTTELKCIEGWATVVTWSGARLRDFIAKYPPATTSGEALNLKNPDDLPGYIGLETPGGGYYVGLEREAALHPQTLLCYEMNGAPLTPEHGAPLRLVTPLKYGIKSLKRIGTLRYVNQRPADYWAEQGYDYHAGH